jgi:hypothetical protein
MPVGDLGQNIPEVGFRIQTIEFVVTSVWMAAARSPPESEPQKRFFSAPGQLVN